MARKKVAAKQNSPPGRLRIVAGKWRSRLLPVAEQQGLRPTSERIRETLFNWLSGDIAGSHCLDLYAGTGALGFEALSRGAATARLIDKSPQVVRILQSSAGSLQADAARIECADALTLLSRPADRRYDVVFLDPPFAHDALEQSCRLLQSNGWLATSAAVYMEQDNKQALPQLPETWHITKQKQAGNVRYMLARLN